MSFGGIRSVVVSAGPCTLPMQVKSEKNLLLSRIYRCPTATRAASSFIVTASTRALYQQDLLIYIYAY